ncbi:hypothetical protein P43SY_000094 [Pythium insidiosum]|uniref:Uncharacterized protein n=1 Tax=Pythium insidiosum TaxID=114742 RepID=A0AAD5Q597_PYTIN|nr:hypothetical protein P43SY_000094 [Pythium insidiosum]
MSGHYQYSVWGSNFKALAKMCRREQQMQQSDDVAASDRRTTVAAPVVKQEPVRTEQPTHGISEPGPSPASLGDLETDDEGDGDGDDTAFSTTSRAMHIKMERVRLEEAPEIAATSIKMERPSVAPRRQPPSDVVDLTEDDDLDSSENEPHHQTTAANRLQHRSAIKTESEWLKHAARHETTETYSTVVDEDPILGMMIHEYNQKSEAIFMLEQQVTRVTEGLRQSVSSFSVGSLEEANRIRDQLSALKNSLTKEKHSRDATVARLVVFHKASSAELAALLSAAAVDIPDAQAASHRKCAAMEAEIRQKHDTLRQLKRNMDGAIHMKGSDAFQEVTRLGAEIAQAEATIRQLYAERLEEFVTLCRFSQHIQCAARSMMAL